MTWQYRTRSVYVSMDEFDVSVGHEQAGWNSETLFCYHPSHRIVRKQKNLSTKNGNIPIKNYSTNLSSIIITFIRAGRGHFTFIAIVCDEKQAREHIGRQHPPFGLHTFFFSSRRMNTIETNRDEKNCMECTIDLNYYTKITVICFAATFIIIWHNNN